ncbi:patched family protein [Necator americanus]|uniref:Patched family protein n=1 Tax=Necator americanus TaxID=51031 RepID=W2TE39_NECAM|nr:patched family protein [Necator americanus]ETN79461.1 patched family protein [Necator americanus]
MRIVCDWISCHPRRTLAVVFAALCPLMSFFLFYPFEVQSDVRRGFAERGGRSASEFKRFADFYNVTYEGLEIWAVLVTEKRSTGRKYMNMSMQLLDEIERLNELVRNLTVVVDDVVVNFEDLHGIEINYLFNWYKYAYSWSEYFSDINLTYPIGSALGHKFFLGSHFFGVNKHKESERGPIEQMEFVTLWYMNQAPNMTQRRQLQALQLQLFELSRADNFSDLISFDMYGDQVANAEMLRGTLQTVYLFTVGIVIMLGFMAFTTSYLTVKSQIPIIAAAIASPAIATAACFAILGWSGFPFNSIMCITPFLVMGIGVDDAFLLLHAWRRYSDQPIKERMRIVVYQIGPSMAITSATNTLAFGVGITSPTPQYAPLNFISVLPELSDSHQLDLFMEMVHRLEHSEGCYGPERTQLLLRDYIEA